LPPAICGEYCVLLVGSRVEAEADAGNRHREVRELTAVERQAFNLGHVDDAADR
jgi:hypothetical protein